MRECSSSLFWMKSEKNTEAALPLVINMDVEVHVSSISYRNNKYCCDHQA